MDCPNCEKELKHHDWYGINMRFDGSGEKNGDIYKCDNEKCELYEETFYTRGDDGELYEGYPC